MNIARLAHVLQSLAAMPSWIELAASAARARAAVHPFTHLSSVLLHGMRAVGVATALILLWPSVAQADPSGAARDLFARGRERRLHGDCSSAIPLFRRAYEVYPSALGSLRNVAECEESLGHASSARRAWIALAGALRTNGDAKYDGWSTDANDGAARLASQIAFLTIQFGGGLPERPVGAGEPHEELNVTLNGDPFPASQLGRPIELDPGPITVRVVDRAGVESNTFFIELRKGESKSVVLPIPGDKARSASAFSSAASSVGDAPDVTSTSARTASGPPPPERGLRTAAWVAFGAGGASLIGAAVAGFAYQSASDDLNRTCPQNRCADSPQSRASVDSIRSRGQTAGTLGLTLLVGGFVGAGAGIALLAFHDRASTALWISPMGVAALGKF